MPILSEKNVKKITHKERNVIIENTLHSPNQSWEQELAVQQMEFLFAPQPSIVESRTGGRERRNHPLASEKTVVVFFLHGTIDTILLLRPLEALYVYPTTPNRSGGRFPSSCSKNIFIENLQKNVNVIVGNSQLLKSLKTLIWFAKHTQLYVS